MGVGLWVGWMSILSQAAQKQWKKNKIWFFLPKRGLQMRLPAKDETMHATHVAKGLFRLNSLPASFLNIKRKSRLVNPITAKTKKKLCFLLKFSVFRKFFPIKNYIPISCEFNAKWTTDFTKERHFARAEWETSDSIRLFIEMQNETEYHMKINA